MTEKRKSRGRKEGGKDKERERKDSVHERQYKEW